MVVVVVLVAVLVVVVVVVVVVVDIFCEPHPLMRRRKMKQEGEYRGDSKRRVLS